MFAKDLIQCTADMKAAAETGRWTLDAQVRAYDLLEKILNLPEGGMVGPSDVYSDTVATWCSSLGPAEDFCNEYRRSAAALKEAYDEEALKLEAARVVRPLEEAVENTRFKAAAAASLHEFAKETFEIWQTGGVFSRRRALRELRERAGFRLESERIGNYVAKTFDLMNEAQTAFAAAQQALFAGNVSYKIKPGVCARLAELLTR